MSALTAVAASPALPTAAPSATGLQAQLQKLQQQYSDCVNCESARTPEGKANIAAIEQRLTSVRSQLDAVGSARAPRGEAARESGRAYAAAAPQIAATDRAATAQEAARLGPRSSTGIDIYV